ncbi:MAG: hypothetical protein IJC71_05055, partial [Clostridia bacterium]|nr:hypothetical protein [Clostridia bacterium]
MMANTFKRMLAAALATTLLAGTMSLPVFAEDGKVVKEETITNEDSTVSNVKTTTTTVVDPETGKMTVVVNVDKKTSGKNTFGATVEGTMTRTDTTVYDQDGNELENSWVENGYTKTQWTEQLTNGSNLPEVKVEMIPGQTTKGSASKTTERIDGNQKENHLDKWYNYTQTETVIDREVTVNTGEIIVSSETATDTVVNGLKHVASGDKQHIYSYGISMSNYFHKYEIKDSDGNVTEIKYYPITNRDQKEYDVLPDEIKALYTFDADKGLYVPTSSSYVWSELSNGKEWSYVLGSLPEQAASAGIETKAPSDTSKEDSSSYDNNIYLIGVHDKAGNIIYTYCMDKVT